MTLFTDDTNKWIDMKSVEALKLIHIHFYGVLIDVLLFEFVFI